ncbi:MAG: class I SAM-dependent methyltransferase [Chloroflexi bacterium]|nr:class I SAM-dependent methyltransferase [Chloroflexota bacterium]
MPRLEATARAGYWPTPARVADAISRYLASPTKTGRRTVRLLDPCARTGEATADIAKALGAESFGIELNTERAEAARTRLDHVLATSAFSVRLANCALSVLFLNPPYAQDDEKRRLEHAFVTAMARALCPGGVLVFLIPQERLAVSARYLASHYTSFAAYRFPDPEFAAFRQMVLFAVRKTHGTHDAAGQAQLERWSETELPPLLPEPAGAPLVVPSLPAGEILFGSLFFDARQAATEAQRRGVWVQPQLTEQLWPPEERAVRPLMPLRRGHLALLIAAGFLNNVVLTHGNQRILVKGRIHKELVPIETDDEDTEVEREVLRTSVVALDLETGALEVIGDGDASAPVGSVDP